MGAIFPLVRATATGLLQLVGWSVPVESAPCNRGLRRAEVCKQYLRLKYNHQSLAVEAFIRSIEETGTHREVSTWDALIDPVAPCDDDLKALDMEFEEWLRH